MAETIIQPAEMEEPIVERVTTPGRRFEPGVLALQVLVLVAVLAFWQFGTEAGIIRKFFFSQPTAVAARLGDWFFVRHTIYKHIEATFVEMVLSFVIGAVFGIVFGFAMARVPLLSKVFSPYITILNALPRVVLAPIFTL